MFIKEPLPVDNSSNYDRLYLINNLHKPSYARTPDDLIDININKNKEFFTKEGALTLAQIAYFDRMGYFEFESGEMSSCFQEMYQNEKYRGYEINFQKNKFYLICKKGDQFKLRNKLNEILKNELSLSKLIVKSPIYLSQALGNKSQVKGWIGLSPVCMFFVNKRMYLDFLKVLSLKNGA